MQRPVSPRSSTSAMNGKSAPFRNINDAVSVGSTTYPSRIYVSESQYDSDSEYNNDESSHGNFRSTSSVVSMLRTFPPQQRRLIILIGLTMALVTALRVAKIGNSFSDGHGIDSDSPSLPSLSTRKNVPSELESESIQQTPVTDGSRSIREVDRDNMSYGEDQIAAQKLHRPHDEESGVAMAQVNNAVSQKIFTSDAGGDTAFEYKTETHVTDKKSEANEVFEQDEAKNDERQNKDGQQDEVYKVMREQQALIQQMNEQLQKQNEIMKLLQVRQQQQQHEQKFIIDNKAQPVEVLKSDQNVAPEISAMEKVDPLANAKSGMTSPELSGFKETWSPHEAGDLPVFWHIPKAGGSTVKDIIGTCHRMTMASESGVTEGHDKDTKIAVVVIGGNVAEGQEGSPFVNVDTTTANGLKKAKMLGLTESGLADVVITPFLFEADDIFASDHRGRLFTLFRHPVDRAVSMFSYLQYATWEPTYNPKLTEMTIAEYARSAYIENNWMTRYLSNRTTGDLNEDNLRVAMDVIRRKFLVGLLTKKQESMERFEKFFRWKYKINPTNQESCRERLLSSGSNANKNKMEKPKPGSKDYELLAWQNQYDIALYRYIEILFDQQETFVTAIPDLFRLTGATCCKCEQPPTC